MDCLGLRSLLKNVEKKNQAYDFDSDDDEARLPAQRAGPHKLFTDDEKTEDKLVAVLVTLASGNSYDEMFRLNRPSTVPGERVSTYFLDSHDVSEFHSYLSGAATPAGSTWASLILDIQQVQPDSVTLNWECCSGCSQEQFPASQSGTRFGFGFGRCMNSTMILMGLALKRGFTVMCSDFSLKALIAQWSEEHLGPNPFVKMGSCDHQFQLSFAPSELQNEEVPQQLQVVGELCATEGKAVVSAMQGTIVYTINPRRKNTDVYNLKVLTVVTAYDNDQAFQSHGGNDYTFDDDDALSSEEQVTGSQNPWASKSQKPSQNEQKPKQGSSKYPEAMMCSVGEGDNIKSGMAGHVTLTYASGGQLVTSMGHWLELTRINTSEEELIRVAASNFGQEELFMLQADLACQTSAFDREQCTQKWAKSSISKSVPTRMKCRTKY